MPDPARRRLLQMMGVHLPEAPPLPPEEEARRLQERERQPQGVLENAHDFLKGLVISDPTQMHRSPAEGVGMLTAAGLPFGPKGIKGMYSRVERLAESLPSQINPHKLSSIFKNHTSGQELEWRKVPEFLRQYSDKKPVPKAELVKHLEENPLDVKVIEKRGAPSDEEINRWYQDQGRSIDDPDAQDWYDAHSPTEHEEYQMPGSIPGSYRETLIQLPTKEPPIRRVKLPDAIEADVDAVPAAGEIDRLRQAGVFRDQHWLEPNPVVGVRHNERTIPKQELVDAASQLEGIDPGSRGRMLENVQSGWEQAGAHRGYVGSPIAMERTSAMGEIQAHIDSTVTELGEKVKQYQNLLPDLDLTGVDEVDAAREVTERLARGVYEGGRREWEAPLRELNELRVSLDNFTDALTRASDDVVPDMPFKGVSTPIRLGLKQQLLDIAHNRPDLEWLGIAPYSELAQRGERMTKKLKDGSIVDNPEFQDVMLPKVLEELLAPFGGKVERGVDLGIRRSGGGVHFSPHIGRYGGAERGGEPILSGLPGVGPDLVNYFTQHQPNVTAPIARLTPEILQQLREKGFPIAVILAMLQAQSQSQPPQNPQYFQPGD